MQMSKQPVAIPLFLLVVTFSLPGIFTKILAQENLPKVPIPVEFMAGNNRMYFQTVVKRKFSPESKLGFLSVSSLASSYANDLEELDMVVPLLVTYTMYKGFGFVGGATINNRVGFSPLVGAQHSFTNKNWVSVTIASLFLNSTKNTELFGIYEYKPLIKKNLNLYSRVQFLYIHNSRENHHARSFLQLRAGLKMNALNFGAGTNLDQYGPQKEFKPNYGLFVSWAFQ
ncbi:hypothetical protein [Arundinibacter roseus]|uniref:hypothetical protein n=1 Tax=Arundinibacter roseus TaxID=2070510 RepID=UPI0018FE6253|nr:hypothetical protein [Arundinibacter roseus]